MVWSEFDVNSIQWDANGKVVLHISLLQDNTVTGQGFSHQLVCNVDALLGDWQRQPETLDKACHNAIDKALCKVRVVIWLEHADLLFTPH